MNKIFLLGSDGQLGNVIHNNLKLRKNYISYNRNTLDIFDLNKLKLKIEKFQPDIIINCIAYTNVRSSENEKELALLINEKYVQNLVNICKNKNIKLIHFSTDYVFNGKKTNQYLETDLEDPLNFYGLTKLNGDKIIVNNLNNYLIIRTSWLFSGTRNCFLKKIYKNIKLNKDFYVNAYSIGKPTYVNDLSEIVSLLIKKIEHGVNFNGIYNFSCEPETTWYEFSNSFFNFLKENKLINSDVQIKKNFDISKDNVLRPKNSSLNNLKINKLLNIKDFYWKKSFINVINNIDENL